MSTSYGSHPSVGSTDVPPPKSPPTPHEPSTEQNSKVVTILLLGLTQSGKSTFVNWLRSISQTQSEEAVEGKGHSSCTKKCGLWEMKIQLTDYKLVDRSPTPNDIQLPNKEFDMLRNHGRWTKANSRLVPTTPNAPVVTFRVTDTPGLDDGDQDDSKNITEVLGTLNKWLQESDNPTVNGIIFLINSKSSFSSSFQELFKYYQKCMPNLFGGLAMLNTNFTVKEWKNKRRQLEENGEVGDSESARAQIIQQRRSDFADLLGRNPLHWYLDSRPDPGDNLENFFSLNSTIDLLRLIASQEPAQIRHMNYVKMTKDMAVDVSIKGLVENKKATWKKFQELIEARSSSDKRAYIADKERLLLLEQIIRNCDADLERVDHNGTVIIRNDSTDQSDDAGFWTRTGRVTTWGGVKKTKEVKEDYDFYHVNFLDGGGAKWEKREKNPQTNAWIGTYRASWGRFPILYVRSHTRSSVFHLESIKRWRKEKINAETQLDQLKAKLGKNKKPPEIDEKLEQLLVMISQCQDVIAKLEEESIPIEALDEAAQRRYKKDPSNINEYDVLDMVRTYHPSLADAWHYF